MHITARITFIQKTTLLACDTRIENPILNPILDFQKVVNEYEKNVLLLWSHNNVVVNHLNVFKNIKVVNNRPADQYSLSRTKHLTSHRNNYSKRIFKHQRMKKSSKLDISWRMAFSLDAWNKTGGHHARFSAIVRWRWQIHFCCAFFREGTGTSFFPYSSLACWSFEILTFIS